jgi:hypothetical protein
MENKNSRFKNIVQLFFILIVYNAIVQRYPGDIYNGNNNFLYNLSQLFRGVPFYFCLHLTTILFITGIGVIIAKKKVIDLDAFTEKIMWIALYAIMIIHGVGVIFKI